MTSRNIQFGYCTICSSKYNIPNRWNHPLFKSYEKFIEFERSDIRNIGKQKINLDLFCIDCLIMLI